MRDGLLRGQALTPGGLLRFRPRRRGANSRARRTGRRSFIARSRGAHGRRGETFFRASLHVRRSGTPKRAERDGSGCDQALLARMRRRRGQLFAGAPPARCCFPGARREAAPAHPPLIRLESLCASAEVRREVQPVAPARPAVSSSQPFSLNITRPMSRALFVALFVRARLRPRSSFARTRTHRTVESGQERIPGQGF